MPEPKAAVDRTCGDFPRFLREAGLVSEVPPWARMIGAIVDAEKRSLLINDAAVLLGVSRRTVYNRIRSGQLDTVRTRGGSQRVLLASIERLLQRERAVQGWTLTVCQDFRDRVADV